MKSKFPFFSEEETQIAIGILQGATVKSCSRLNGVPEHKCVKITKMYCARTNRKLYDTLLPNENWFEQGVPITTLRAYAAEFIRRDFSDDPAGAKLSENSSIWEIPDVQLLTLNALWQRDIETVADILKHNEKTLLRMPKLGKTGLRQLKDILGKYGFVIASL
jgi:hypothetical protein